MYLLFCLDTNGKVDFEFGATLCEDMEEVKDIIDYYCVDEDAGSDKDDLLFERKEFRYMKINEKDLKMIEGENE